VGVHSFIFLLPSHIMFSGVGSGIVLLPRIIPGGQFHPHPTLSKCRLRSYIIYYCSLLYRILNSLKQRAELDRSRGRFFLNNDLHFLIIIITIRYPPNFHNRSTDIIFHFSALVRYYIWLVKNGSFVRVHYVL